MKSVFAVSFAFALRAVQVSRQNEKRWGQERTSSTRREDSLGEIMLAFRSGKREDFIDWEHYFMGVAFLAAQRSKDPKSQVGACIVDGENRIVGVGYNGFPRGCSDDEFPWTKSSRELESKFTYVCHAEMNAVLNTNIIGAKGCKIYVALFPCNECAKVIIQSGITEVIYMSDKNHWKYSSKASKRMFEAAGVKYRQFKPKVKTIVIDFYALPIGVDNSDCVSSPKKERKDDAENL